MRREQGIVRRRASHPHQRVGRPRGARAGRGRAGPGARRRPGPDPRRARRRELRRHPRAGELLPRPLRAAADRRAPRSRACARTRASASSRSSGPAATPSTSPPTRRRSFPIEDGVGDATALALLLQGLTAWHLYRTSAKLAAGESVVVHAAAGGVGSLAVQLGRHMGAGRVIATASTRGQARRWRCRSAPTRPSTSTPRTSRDALIEANGGERVDAVFEMAGGRVLRGVDEGARAVRAPRHLRDRLARAERAAHGRADAPQPRGRRLLADALPARAGDGRGRPLRELGELVARGELRVVEGETYGALRGPPRCTRTSPRAAPSGKLVIDPLR